MKLKSPQNQDWKITLVKCLFILALLFLDKFGWVIAVILLWPLTKEYGTGLFLIHYLSQRLEMGRK